MRERTALETTPAAAEQHCVLANLVYVDDTTPGITRRVLRGKFCYFDVRGERIRDAEVVRRLNALAIPPAYTQVWICPDENGHLQATGRDARGRKQYRYHAQWQAVRGEHKYGQLVAFGTALPRIRRRVARDLGQPELCHDKVVAVVVRLLETTLIRIGTAAYARENRSYGLTTLKRRHVTVSGDRIRFRFRGKSGVPHDVTVNDRRLARVIRHCTDLSGQTLFHYTENDVARPVDSSCVNGYLREASGVDFTAKHYRTWAASVAALAALRQRAWEDEKQAAKTIVEVVRAVAKQLGNTPAVCRSSYIHPAVLAAYLAGGIPPLPAVTAPRGLNADERRFLAFLRSQG